MRSQTLELPEIVSGEVLESITGSTVNTSKSTGSTSSLSFGSSTRFGTSASVNGTSATKSSSESIFKVGALKFTSFDHRETLATLLRSDLGFLDAPYILSITVYSTICIFHFSKCTIFKKRNIFC